MPTTRPGMSWHQLPSDDAWKKVTLATVAGLAQQIWLRCNGCGHEQHVDPLAFAAFHDLDAATPLLAIDRRLKCTACGESKAQCWPHAAYRPGGGPTG